MKLVISGSFDPLSKKELEEIKLLRKKHRVRKVYLFLEKDGHAVYEERLRLLKKAVKPYRYIVITDKKEGDVMVSLCSLEEEQIRNGEYRLAAYGLPFELFLSGVYVEETLQALCKKTRIIHSKGVADTAVQLAKIHGINCEEARIAGLLHDLTKKQSQEEGERILKHWRPEILGTHPNIWHSYTAPLWIRRHMGIVHHTILHAIEHHTLGDGKTSLDRILYIADKIEPGRGYDTSREMALAGINLAKAAELIQEEAKAYILEKENRHV